LGVYADEVLVNTEDMAAVADELRGKIHEKIQTWARTSEPSVEEQRMVSTMFGDGAQ
jgi:hypothetical protein